MGNRTALYIVRYIALVLVQVFILNKIQLSGYINPYLYILFILILPVDIPRWILLSSAFFLGLSIDFFSGILGVHAAASVFIAYVRPGLIRMIGLKDDTEPGTEPSIRNFGFLWFFTYSAIMVFMHHSALFFIEVFRFREIFMVISRILLSSLATLVLIILTQYLFYKKR